MKYKEEMKARRVRFKVESGVRGIYTGLSYRIKQLIVPAIIAVVFLTVSYFCVSNELYSSGALRPDKVTIYCTQRAYDGFSSPNFHKVFAKMAKVVSTPETFFDKFSVHICEEEQLQAIAVKYGVSDTVGTSIKYILIDENNVLIECSTSSHYYELLEILGEYGYLEVKYEK